MPILSLCTGYGGLDAAVEALTGDKTAYFAEVDPAACLVLQHHWPDVPNIGDITEYDFTQLSGLVDVIAAGFPCRNISNAGRRDGIDGEWSRVWKDVCRAVRDIRPRHAFLENVAAIRSRGLDVVAEDLAAVGYDLWWTTLRASDVGAPHQRDRWLGIAVPHADRQSLAVGSLEPARGQRQAAERSDPASEDAHGPARDERGCTAPRETAGGGAWTYAR